MVEARYTKSNPVIMGSQVPGRMKGDIAEARTNLKFVSFAGLVDKIYQTVTEMWRAIIGWRLV